MLYPFLADMVLVVHLAFVVFVLCGGLLTLRVAVDRVAAPAGGCLGRGRRIHRLDLPAHTAGELVPRAGWRDPLSFRLYCTVSAAGALS